MRGVSYASAVLPKHRRRLENVDRGVTDLWQRPGHYATSKAQRAPSPKRRSRLRRSRGPILCVELDAWNARRLDDLELVFVWADGVYLGAGPDDEAARVPDGDGADRMGRKHLIALREAAQASEVAWEELFADLASRGLAAPAFADR